MCKKIRTRLGHAWAPLKEQQKLVLYLSVLTVLGQPPVNHHGHSWAWLGLAGLHWAWLGLAGLGLAGLTNSQARCSEGCQTAGFRALKCTSSDQAATV
jgi:hypothetical protein